MHWSYGLHTRQRGMRDVVFRRTHSSRITRFVRVLHRVEPELHRPYAHWRWRARSRQQSVDALSHRVAAPPSDCAAQARLTLASFCASVLHIRRRAK